VASPEKIPPAMPFVGGAKGETRIEIDRWRSEIDDGDALCFHSGRRFLRELEEGVLERIQGRFEFPELE
jgi:hypothetical protein